MILSPCHLHSCHWLAEVCLSGMGFMPGSHYSLLEPISTDGHYKRLIWLHWVKDGEAMHRVKQRQCYHTWILFLILLLLQEIKRLHLQGSRTALNSQFVPEICNLIWNKLRLFIQNHCKIQRSDKRHNPTIIRPTIQHPGNNKVTSSVLLV